MRDQIKALKLSAGRNFDGFFNSLEAGLDYSERDKSMNRTEVYYNLKSNRAPVLIPANLLRSPTDLSFAGSPIRMVNFDVPSALSLYDAVPASVDQAPGRIWAVHEKVTAAYTKLGFDTDWGLPLHGTVGLRVVRAKQWSNGQLWNPVTKQGDPVSGGLISPALDGIGVSMSYSNTRSSMHQENNPSKPLDGLSGKATNFTVYYERDGVSARLCSRHRSPFVTTVRGTFGENVASMISSETILDAQVGYAFESGAFKGLSLTLQVNNLRDRPYRTRVGVSTGSVDPNATLPERYTSYGRQFLLGGTNKF